MGRNGEAADWVPDSCALPTADRPLRVAEFDRLLGESAGHAVRRSATVLEVTLPAGAEAPVRDLTRREGECCSFFTFRFEPTGTAVVLSIEVPPSQVAVLDGLATRVKRLEQGSRPGVR